MMIMSDFNIDENKTSADCVYQSENGKCGYRESEDVLCPGINNCAYYKADDKYVKLPDGRVVDKIAHDSRYSKLENFMDIFVVDVSLKLNCLIAGEDEYLSKDEIIKLFNVKLEQAML
jgi:hypothetical protein